MSKFGDFLGSINNSFQIGIGSSASSLRQILFRNGFNSSLNWTPTAARNIKLPDRSGSIILDDDSNFRNRIIGGNFDTNPFQRGLTVTTTASTYLADRWIATTTVARSMRTSRVLDAPAFFQSGMFTEYCLEYAYLGSPATIQSGDATGLRHCIEGFYAKYLMQKPFIVSFWVKSSKTGIYAISARNGATATDRSCVIEYTISIANKWEYKNIVFPSSPSLGDWNYTNGSGLFLTWQLATGSTFITSTLNSWITGNFVASPNCVNWLDTTNAYFRIALVQCEAGSEATIFEERSAIKEFSICQRYYHEMHLSQRFAATASGQFSSSTIIFPVAMRSTPTAILLNAPQRVNLSAVNIGATNSQYGRYEIQANASGDAYALFDRFSFNAEI
jgi:hypothetical protein